MAAWGYFLYQGVRDPLGGINSLWPLFGIANQLLAAIALCVATTILIKMHGARYMWITCVPLAWLVVVTFHGRLAEDFLRSPRAGFSGAGRTAAERAAMRARSRPAKIAETQGQIFNARLDAVVCGVFLVLVTLILADSLRVWFGILRGGKEVKAMEAPFVLTQLRAEELCRLFCERFGRSFGRFPMRMRTSGTCGLRDERTRAMNGGDFAISGSPANMRARNVVNGLLPC